MFNDVENYLSDQFLSGSDYAYVTVHVGFGVEGLSRAGVNYYDSGDFLGTVQYSDTFDITTEAAQNSTLQACQTVRDYLCSAEGCSGGSGKLAVPGLVVCWLESFLAYYRNSTGSSGYPTGSTFNTYYDLWAAESQYGEWSELTGKVEALAICISFAGPCALCLSILFLLLLPLHFSQSAFLTMYDTRTADE